MQTARDALEVVIVAPSVAAIRSGLADLQDFRCWRIVELGDLRSSGQAKPAGIRCATASVVVRPRTIASGSGMGAALIEAHRGNWAAVGPAMDNGNPQSLISWADFIIGYGPWFNPPGAEEADLLPGHNTSYKRDLLLGYGERLEALLGAESNLHWDLRARGFRLYLEPAAKAFHTNFTKPLRWIPFLFYSGRVFAAERRRNWPLLRRAGYSAGAWLIPIVRFMRLIPGVRRTRPDLVAGVSAPLLFALIVDAVGQGIG